MPKINAKTYGGGASRAALSPEDLGGKKATVLVISAVDPDVKIPDNERAEGFRIACTLSFREFTGEDDRALYLNKTQVQFLIDQFGNETEDWVGERVPLEVVKVRDPRKDTMVSKVYIADPKDSWGEILKASRPRAAAKARKR